MLTTAIFTISGIVVALALYVIYHSMVRPKNSPPGPVGLPVIGSFHQIAPDFHSNLPKLAKIYGNIFSIKASVTDIVCLVGYDLIKEVITDRAKEFADRPSLPKQKMLRGEKQLGIAPAKYGPSWLTHRKFFFTAFRSMGMNKRGIEKRITDELPAITEELEKTRDLQEPFDLMPVLEYATLNVLASFAFGNRYSYDDQKLKRLLKANNDLLHSSNVLDPISGILFNLIPGLHRYWIPKSMKPAMLSLQQIRQFVKEEIEYHQNSLDHTSPRDFIDYYLLEMKKNENENLTLDALEGTVMDLFQAGTETTSTTLAWSFLYMINNPDVQEKVHNEIDKVIGLDREPQYDDRLSMPYCEATILETQRKATIVPTGLIHTPLHDTDIRGYKVAKNTPIMQSYHSIHYSPEHWKNPENFDPGNFLDDDGTVGKRDAFMPFGGGLRICVGMNLAKQELFILFVGILQKFKLSLPAGCRKASEEISAGMILAPKPYKVLLERRF